MPTKKDNIRHSIKIRERVLLVIRTIIMQRVGGIRSQTMFGARAHIRPESISRWEKANGFPTLENLADICQEFEISPAYLILGKGNMHGDAELMVRIEKLEKRVSELEKKR